MRPVVLALLMASVSLPALAGQVPPISDGGGGREPELAMSPPAPVINPGPAVVPLTKTQKAALQASKARVNNKVRPVAGDDGVLRFPIGAAEPFTICSPGKWCRIELMPGEIISGGNGQAGALELTDKTNWSAKPMAVGSGKNLTSVVLVSPRYRGANASLGIGTTGHSYVITLLSTDVDYIHAIGFTDPAAEQRKAEKEYAKAVAPPAPATVDIADSGVRFEIEGGSSMRPYSVYSDGVQTMIVFPGPVPAEAKIVGVADDGGLFSSDSTYLLSYSQPEPTKILVASVEDKIRIVIGEEKNASEIRRVK